MKWSKLYNPLVSALLRSPLHGLVGKHMALLTISGRKTGHLFSVPVSYTQHNSMLAIFSQREHIWWRNLRGSSNISVRLGGKQYQGLAEAIEEPECVTDALATYLDEHPDHARY
jgi:hypothetical protein